MVLYRWGDRTCNVTRAALIRFRVEAGPGIKSIPSIDEREFAMATWMMWAAGAVVAYFILKPKAPKGANLDPAEVRQWIADKKGLQIVDVRSPSEYQGGHLEGSVLIPLGQLESRLGELDPQRPLIVYCRSGMRSAQALNLLMKKGYPQAKHLGGGIVAWKAAGQKVIQ
jgi:rhodanese-related sulfurtransferase